MSLTAQTANSQSLAHQTITFAARGQAKIPIPRQRVSVQISGHRIWSLLPALNGNAPCHWRAGGNPASFGRFLDPCPLGAAFGRNQKCLLKKQGATPLQCRGDRVGVGRRKPPLTGGHHARRQRGRRGNPPVVALLRIVQSPRIRNDPGRHPGAPRPLHDSAVWSRALKSSRCWCIVGGSFAISSE